MYACLQHVYIHIHISFHYFYAFRVCTHSRLLTSELLRNGLQIPPPKRLFRNSIRFISVTPEIHLWYLQVITALSFWHGRCPKLSYQKLVTATAWRRQRWICRNVGTTSSGTTTNAHALRNPKKQNTHYT